VVSDLNGAYGSTRYDAVVTETVRELAERQPDLVICTGDMVAGQKRPILPKDHVEAMWEAFHAVVTDPLREAGVPLAVTPGNHDASAYADFATEREVFRQQWLDRSPELRFVDRDDYPYNYAFAVGEVLFVSLEATTPGPLDAGQRGWLDDLLTRERGRFRHRVVFSHLPVFAFAQGRESEVTADHELVRLLERHRVDLYLSGHHHAFYPGFRHGVRYVGQAGLGSGARPLIGDERVSERAVTWLEFDAAGVQITALAAPGLDRAIERASLPRAIPSRHGTLRRDDLASPADDRGTTSATMPPR
jgi:hypothetical protein